MMGVLKGVAAVMGLWLGLTASAAAQQAPLPKVVESFNVGDHVYVRALALEPRRTALWVGTSTGALEVDLQTRNVRRTYTRADGLANEYVFAIGIDSDGYKWFGTNTGGVTRFREGEWKTYFPMHGLADYWIYAFAEDASRNMWVGTWAGANKVELEGMRFTTYLRELVNEWVYGIAIDAQQRVWFGTEGGVSMFDGSAWKHWTHEDGLGAQNIEGLGVSANTGLGTRARHDLNVLAGGAETYNPSYVFSILAEPDGTIWAGTWGGGVARFDGERWTNLTTADGLAGNLVYSIARDDQGALWFGTNHGLSRYDGKVWTTYGRAEGLLEDHVYAIAAGGGDVWAGTRRGVVRIGY